MTVLSRKVTTMAKWLVKSEPSECSIELMRREKTMLWDGVRNYQARNFLRSMKKGDEALFYHSSEAPVGVAGLVMVHAPAVPDPTQFDTKSKYYDPAATEEAPRWWCPKFAYVRTFPRLVPLAELRNRRELAKMALLQRGSRLSVQPVTDREFQTIISMAEEG